MRIDSFALIRAGGDPMGALRALSAGLDGYRCAECGEDELTQQVRVPLHARAGVPPLVVLEAEQGHVTVSDPGATHTIDVGAGEANPRFRLLSVVLFRARSGTHLPHYCLVWRGAGGRWWRMDDNENGAVAMEMDAATRDAWCAVRPDGWSPVMLTYDRQID